MNTVHDYVLNIYLQHIVQNSGLSDYYQLLFLVAWHLKSGSLVYKINSLWESKYGNWISAISCEDLWGQSLNFLKFRKKLQIAMHAVPLLWLHPPPSFCSFVQFGDTVSLVLKALDIHPQPGDLSFLFPACCTSHLSSKGPFSSGSTRSTWLFLNLSSSPFLFSRRD